VNISIKVMNRLDVVSNVICGYSSVNAVDGIKQALRGELAFTAKVPPDAVPEED
jgi:hypothetical protein